VFYKSNTSIKLVGFSSLPNGLKLFEGNQHDRDDPPNGELTMIIMNSTPCTPSSMLDPIPNWGILLNFKTLVDVYIQKAWHTLPSLSLQIVVEILNGPPRLNPLRRL
jgi:hypothetical protein